MGFGCRRPQAGPPEGGIKKEALGDDGNIVERLKLISSSSFVTPVARAHVGIGPSDGSIRTTKEFRDFARNSLNRLLELPWNSK